MNTIWNYLASIGVTPQDSPDVRRWKRLQNQLLVFGFILLIFVNAIGIIIYPGPMIGRVITLAAFMLLLIGLNALRLFELSRLLFAIGLIPLYVLPNLLTNATVHFPYLAFNALIVFQMQYLFISHILPNGKVDKYENLYIGFFLIAFATDYFYVPPIVSLIHGQIWLTTDIFAFFILKSFLSLIVLMQLFTTRYVSHLVKGLLDANKSLDASIDDKIEALLKKMNNE